MFSGKAPRRLTDCTTTIQLESRRETRQIQHEGTRCYRVLGWACRRCICPPRGLLLRTILALSILYFVAFVLEPQATGHFWYDPTQRITAIGSGRVNLSVLPPVKNIQSLIFRASAVKNSDPKELNSTTNYVVSSRRIRPTTLVHRNFVEKFGHVHEDNATLFLDRLKVIIGREWSPDENRKQEIGDDLRTALGETGSLGNFLLTKKNAPVGKLMPFYMYGKSAKVTTTLWKYLSQDSIFKPGQFKRCSIVGSSGILNGSQCGSTIDEAQFVVRFNIAPVRGFETDVGNKTGFTTLNPSFIRSKLNILKTSKDRSELLQILRQFNGTYLWLPIFAVIDNLSILTKTTEITSKSGFVHPIHGHPKHFLSVSTLWRSISNDTKTWPSTGLYSILTFFDVCDQIDVFGFWPLPTFMNGSSAPYHYHDTIVAKQDVHTFSAEFQYLVRMHELGVIRMHFQPCL